MNIITRPEFEPEVLVSVFDDDSIAFSCNDGEQGNWAVDDIFFFQEELPDKYYPDNAEWDPAFKLVLKYVYECIHETGYQINDGLITEDEHEELDDLYYNGDAKALFEWRFGSLENGLQYVEYMRQLLKSFATKEHINFMDKRKVEEDSNIETNSKLRVITSTYRIIMEGIEDHIVGDNDWAKMSEIAAYYTSVPFKGL